MSERAAARAVVTSDGRAQVRQTGHDGLPASSHRRRQLMQKEWAHGSRLGWRRHALTSNMSRRVESSRIIHTHTHTSQSSSMQMGQRSSSSTRSGSPPGGGSMSVALCAAPQLLNKSSQT
jgi:hypothetical protein